MDGNLWIANDGVSLGRISIREAEWCGLHEVEELPNVVELLSRIASEDSRENRVVRVFVCRGRMSGIEGERNCSGQIDRLKS